MASLKEFFSYKSAFEMVKTVTVLVIVSSLLLNIFMFYKYTESLKQMKTVIYVMDKEGNTSVAEAKNADEYRVKQCEYAAKVTYTLWYQIDEHSFESNTKEALNYYLGRCGKYMIDDYNQKKTLFNLRDKNLVLTVKIKDCKVDLKTKKGYIVGVQTIHRFDGELLRNMNVEFDVFDVTPTDQNPFGVKFENWNIVDDSVLE